jgi:hypothetical protein
MDLIAVEGGALASTTRPRSTPGEEESAGYGAAANKCYREAGHVQRESYWIAAGRVSCSTGWT